MGRVGNSASVSGVLMLPVLGLNMAVRLVCSIEKTNNVVCSFVFNIIMLLKGILAYVLGCHGSLPQKLYSFIFNSTQVNFQVCPQMHMGEMQDTVLRKKVLLQ